MTQRRFSAIAAEGDRLKTLQALRDEIAAAIDVVTDASELSSLALRLQRVLAEIQELGGASKKEEPNELAARRDAKLQASSGP
jgi:hypothetical protein